ncbi:MAG: hypothetical protein HY074_06465 [Deltaproteobacteria bacterium]|nr:hypothetical protein [Deltaproteobacteria bacterium]
MKQPNRPEFVVFFVLSVLATLALRWNHFDLPLYHDEAGFFSQQAYRLYRTHFQLFSQIQFMEIYHPQLYYALLAALTLLFGWKMQVLHSTALLVSGLLCTSIYSLARLRASRPMAALAVAGFFLSTLYRSSSLSIEPDFSAAAFGLLALGSALSMSWKRGAVFFAVSCLCNGTAVIFAPVLACLIFNRVPRSDFRPVFLRFFAPAFIGLSVWCLYFIGIHKGLGVYFEANFPVLGGPTLLFERFIQEWPNIIFMDSGRKIISLVLLAGLAWQLIRRYFSTSVVGRTSGHFRALVAALLTQFLFLVFFGLVNPRYATVSTALLYVLGSWALADLKAGLLVQVAAVAVASSLGTSEWNNGDFAYEYQAYRAGYVEQIRALQAVAKYLETEWPDAVIYARWIWAIPLSAPRAGYVTRPLEAISIQDKIENFRFPTANDRKAFLLFSSPVDPPLPEDSSAAVTQLRAHVTGPCRSWEKTRAKFYLCPLN